MLLVNYHEQDDCKFAFPFRMFISGSSQSGKTYFAEKLLRHHLFQERISAVHYRHPDYLDDAPVFWHETLPIPVNYQSGIPSMEELCRLEPNTCVVLDDLYEECISSKAVDYLCRVLSGKKKLCVIIMSQRYFAQGRFGLNIRNNCNLTVLLRNTDSRVNKRVSHFFNVQRQVSRCLNKKSGYPYVLIDTSPKAMVSGFRVYEDIFSKYKKVHSDGGMRGYVIPENEFNKYFLKVNDHLAKLKDENPTKTRKRKYRREKSDSEKSRSESEQSESSKSTEFSESD